LNQYNQYVLSEIDPEAPHSNNLNDSLNERNKAAIFYRADRGFIDFIEANSDKICLLIQGHNHASLSTEYKCRNGKTIPMISNPLGYNTLPAIPIQRRLEYSPMSTPRENDTPFDHKFIADVSQNRAFNLITSEPDETATNFVKQHHKNRMTVANIDNKTYVYRTKTSNLRIRSKIDRAFGAHTKSILDDGGNIIASKRVAKNGKT
jgi:hypothetical protein